MICFLSWVNPWPSSDSWKNFSWSMLFFGFATQYCLNTQHSKRKHVPACTPLNSEQNDILQSMFIKYLQCIVCSWMKCIAYWLSCLRANWTSDHGRHQKVPLNILNGSVWKIMYGTSKLPLNVKYVTRGQWGAIPGNWLQVTLKRLGGNVKVQMWCCHYLTL